MKLINKDAVVAEIESYINGFCDRNGYLEDAETNGIAYETLCDLKDSIDTLEVKEVDLDKEIELTKGDYEQVDVAWNNDFDYIARHFFELGLKANQENNVIGTLEREVKIDAGGYPYINCDIEFYDYDKDIPLAKEGDKVKVVLVKGE